MSEMHVYRVNLFMYLSYNNIDHINSYSKDIIQEYILVFEGKFKLYLAYLAIKHNSMILILFDK